ncbi:hypothetical protein KCP70_16965 [Salmonella enterica subsp. enterica]|nr:hypothetical protein KCP70_16965 [Salmonella enterica subsp. enterica]
MRVSNAEMPDGACAVPSYLDLRFPAFAGRMAAHSALLLALLAVARWPDMVPSLLVLPLPAANAGFCLQSTGILHYREQTTGCALAADWHDFRAAGRVSVAAASCPVIGVTCWYPDYARRIAA